MRAVIMKMVEEIMSGGKVSRDEIAHFIGKTETQFNNRLYQTNNQKFTVQEILMIQNKYEVSHFTDWVCQETGGVFVPTPDREDLDKTELFDLLVAEQKAISDLTNYYVSSLEDGVITKDEYDVMVGLHNKIYKTLRARIEATAELYKG